MSSMARRVMIVFLVAISVLTTYPGPSWCREHGHVRQGWRKVIDFHGNHHRRQSHHKHRVPHTTASSIEPRETGIQVAASSFSPSSVPTMFNVLDFGARGDGKTDDTNAFHAVWAAACELVGPTVLVPFGYTFLVKPISFSGPNCGPNMVFQLEGKITAPTGSQVWGTGLLQWIEFTKLSKITIKGKGVIEGQGSVWWSDSSTKPTALRFYGSTDVMVTGITIQNSPQTHLKFDACTNVQVSGITVSSPGDSPNTDGIHLQNSKTVLIHDSNLACGDDCVSIQMGCSNVLIHNVNCGPGHGISIGGLGRDYTKACVSNITVRDTKMQNTLTGVRIKTWQGGSGSVRDIMFSNIRVSEVATPIMIDHFYCDKGRCENDTAAVAVSGVTYDNIRGTYTYQPVHFACSDSLPCAGVSLSTIQLQQVQTSSHSYDPYCWQTYGELKTPTVPTIDCLQKGKPFKSPSQTVTC